MIVEELLEDDAILYFATIELRRLSKCPFHWGSMPPPSYC